MSIDTVAEVAVQDQETTAVDESVFDQETREWLSNNGYEIYKLEDNTMGEEEKASGYRLSVDPPSAREAVINLRPEVQEVAIKPDVLFIETSLGQPETEKERIFSDENRMLYAQGLPASAEAAELDAGSVIVLAFKKGKDGRPIGNAFDKRNTWTSTVIEHEQQVRDWTSPSGHKTEKKTGQISVGGTGGSMLMFGLPINVAPHDPNFASANYGFLRAIHPRRKTV